MFPFLRRRRVAQAAPSLFSYIDLLQAQMMEEMLQEAEEEKTLRQRRLKVEQLEEENRLLERALEAKRKREELLSKLQEP